MAWNDISVAYVLDQFFGFQSANKLRENIIALAGLGAEKSFGGDRQIGDLTAAWKEVPNYRDIVINGTNLGGFTKQARIQRKTSDVSTSVQCRVRNLTDNSTAGTGAVYNATTNWDEETFAVVLAAGVKVYRLQFIGGDALNDIYAIGHLEIFA